MVVMMKSVVLDEYVVRFDFLYMYMLFLCSLLNFLFMNNDNNAMNHNDNDNDNDSINSVIIPQLLERHSKSSRSNPVQSLSQA